MDSDELWGGDLRLEGERRDKKVTGEIFKIRYQDIRNGKENTGLSRERRNTEGEIEEQSGKEDVNI